MQDIEIEIQVKIERDETLKKFLTENAKFISENRQIDEYFTPAHRNFVAVKPIGEWFRIREEKGLFTINYKKWHYENGIGTYADEFETEIGDKVTAQKIFLALDLKSLVVVDKTRKKFMFKDYEIALDNVKNLGNFVEIEYKGKKAVDPKATLAEMLDFLKKIGCGTIERNNGGYPMLLLFPADAHYIKIA
jgi:predicted adenylyl cyclase CyaB